MLIKNLIQAKLIQPGTWLGISNVGHECIYQRVRVCEIDQNQIWAHVPTQVAPVPIPDHVIQEVDGMLMHRFCAQADLNPQGEKLKPKPRRGRKPKHK